MHFLRKPASNLFLKKVSKKTKQTKNNKTYNN